MHSFVQYEAACASGSDFAGVCAGQQGRIYPKFGKSSTPDMACVVIDSNQFLFHHIQLFKAIGVLRICDISYMLQHQ